MGNNVLGGNVLGRKVEDEAVAWLLPRMPGARDTRHLPGAVADLEWEGRQIDIQAYGGLTPRGARVRLEARQYEAAVGNPDYELWLVENFLAGPEAIRVTVIAGAQLARLVEKARPRQYMEMAVPVAEFTAARARTEDAVAAGLVPGEARWRRPVGASASASAYAESRILGLPF